MSEYLSVDIDYFLIRYFDELQNLSLAERFIKKLISLKKPIDVVLSHEYLIHHIEPNIKKIYNVDFHSDIAHNYGTFDLNEGTWLNFIDNSRNMEFQWNYPSYKHCYVDAYGTCDTYPYKWATHLMPYKKVSRVSGLRKINFDAVSRIGICISPPWCEDGQCYDLLSQFDIFKDYIDDCMKAWEA